MKATLNSRVSSATIKVTTNGGVIQPSASSVSLRNQVQELRSIEDLPDVSEVNVTDGATLIYNSATDKYEVRPYDFTSSSLDGGTF